MKRVTSIVMALLILICSTIGVASASMVISNENENTNLEFREPGFVYVEFVQNGNAFPIETDKGFVKSTVTAEDANGNVLGDVHSVDGVLDYSMYLGQAVRLHIVNQYTDEYIILPDENGNINLPGATTTAPDSSTSDTSTPSPSAPAPSAPSAPGGGGVNPLTIFGCVILVIMITIILTASITCAREKRKAK